jgi:hypothetical protein
MNKPTKFAGRSDYFAANKPGLATTFRVSGRRGELARRFARGDNALEDAKRMNRAYDLGFRHGHEIAADLAGHSESGD